MPLVLGHDVWYISHIMALPIEERFWPKVEKTETCWNWTASCTGFGHGQISYNGRPRGAHIVSYELVYGAIPSGLCVLHRCDNPRCVRPEHLFLGTRGDNVRDMHRKKRWHYVRAGDGRKRVPTGRPKGVQPTPPSERFWPKVNIEGGDAEPCWPFMGSKNKYGYGLFYMNDIKRKVPAHRIAYALHFGSFDRTLIVRHRCDNPPCCNPSHLILGTIADNNRDRKERGRNKEQHGEANANVKIKDADLPRIHELRAKGWTQMQIAAEFGVKQPQISRILRGNQRQQGSS